MNEKIAAILKAECTGSDDHDSPYCYKCASMQKDLEAVLTEHERATRADERHRLLDNVPTELRKEIERAAREDEFRNTVVMCTTFPKAQVKVLIKDRADQLRKVGTDNA